MRQHDKQACILLITSAIQTIMAQTKKRPHLVMMMVGAELRIQVGAEVT